MLQSVVFRTLSRSHWTAFGVHEPTLTVRSARQHFTAWMDSGHSGYLLPRWPSTVVMGTQVLTWGGMDTRSRRKGVGISRNSNTSTEACTPTSTNKMSSTRLPWRLVIWELQTEWASFAHVSACQPRSRPKEESKNVNKYIYFTLKNSQTHPSCFHII